MEMIATLCGLKRQAGPETIPIMNPLRTFLCVASSVLTGVLQAAAPSDYFKEWPAGASPTEVGKRITENFLKREIYKHRTGVVVYPEVCAWYGALTWAKQAGDTALRDQLIKRFEVFHSPEGAKMISDKDHVDYRVFGIVPLEIHMQVEDERCLKIGQGLADDQWKTPTEDGLTHEARYWIDDMYMIPAIQLQAYRATGNKTYLDRAALTSVAYLDKLQQENGLFLHAPDSPFYWGRGNGWFAAGMAELLLDLPASHPRHARVLECYRKMMSSLLQYQTKEGLWRQLVDKEDSWPETSGSAMFAFALVTGVKNGWLDAATYGPAARKAWLALVALVDQDGNLGEVCEGTNKGFRMVGPDLQKQHEFYLARKRIAGDRHGQAPMLWTATALLR